MEELSSGTLRASLNQSIKAFYVLLIVASGEPSVEPLSLIPDFRFIFQAISIMVQHWSLSVRVLKKALVPLHRECHSIHRNFNPSYHTAQRHPKNRLAKAAHTLQDVQK